MDRMNSMNPNRKYSFNYTLNHPPKLYYSKHYDFIISLPFYPSLNKITTKKITTSLFGVLIPSIMEVSEGVMMHMGPPTIGTSNVS
jgi:hypothetical protein